MSTPPQSWEQPQNHSGWGATLRRWGPALGPFAPLAIGLVVPSPVAIAAAGTLLATATVATATTLRRNVWTGFQPGAGESFDADAGELPEPALLSTLGLDGLRVDALLLGGPGDDEWMAFQTVDRLGGRTTRVVLPLPGRGRRVSMVLNGRRRTAMSNALGTDSQVGVYRVVRGHGLADQDLYHLGTRSMRAVLRLGVVRSWGVRDRWLFAELITLAPQSLRADLTSAVDWLRRLRRGYPPELLTPLQETPADGGEWPVLPQAAADDDAPFRRKGGSRPGRAPVRPPGSP